MHPAFASVDHRIEPPPSRPWIMTQRWCDLLFAHWPVPPEALARALPAAFVPDLFEGEAWIGVVPFRMERLARAAERFAGHATDAERAEYTNFLAQHKDWLDDYALYMALSEQAQGRDWCDWEAPLASRERGALKAAAEQHAPRVAFWKFCQWCFFRQWLNLRRYANERGVEIVGDAPIFIAYQSAEVWARPELFELDERFRPTVVAGVPPDAFTASGQRWGNPLYRWSAHSKERFAWWVERIRRCFELVDVVRIDHFRGFAAYWEIAATEPTAIHGRWLPSPGEALFKAVARALGPVPIIAEDLGIITPDVVALRKKFAFPGMRILQFAFGGGSGNPYLPHNHESDSVVYTGTHDNDTTVGWWAAATEREHHHARAYLGTDGHDIAWAMMRAGAASVADTVVHPMQDILVLPTDCRMNLPGSASGWWVWRFEWSQVHPWHGQRLADMTRLFGRR